MKKAILFLILALTLSYGIFKLASFDYCPYYYHGLHCLPIK